MAKGKQPSGSGRGGAGGQPPPPDRGPVKVDFEFQKKYPMRLRSGNQKPWEMVGFLDGGGRTNPPVVEIEEVPPKFVPKDSSLVDIQITFVAGDGRRVKGKIVGPEPVAKQAKEEWEKAVSDSTVYWSKKYPSGEEVDIAIEEGRLQYMDIDPDHNLLPLRLRAINLPRDWKPEEGDIRYVMKVKGIVLDPKTKELVAELYAADIAESKQQLQEWIDTIKERIKEGENDTRIPIDFFEDLKKEGNQWKLTGLQTDDIKYDAYFEVPDGWTVDQLKSNAEGKVIVFYTDWFVKGGMLQLLFHFEGFDPKAAAAVVVTSGAVPGTPGAAPDKAPPKDVASGQGRGLEGRVLWRTLESALSGNVATQMEQVLRELDSAELAEKGLSERLAVLRKAESIISGERRKILADPETFESDASVHTRYNKLGGEKDRVAAEIQRVEAAIENARKILAKESAEEVARRAAEEAAKAGERSAREADLAKDMVDYTPLVKHQVEYAIVEQGIDIRTNEDIEDLRRFKAQLEKVYAVREAWLRVGGRMRKEDGSRYSDQEFVYDVLLADGLIPLIVERIGELEGAASGSPVPSPRMPDVRVSVRTSPVGAGTPAASPDATRPAAELKPVAVEVEEDVDIDEMVEWLEKNRFGTGEFVGLTRASRLKFEKLSGLGTELPEMLRIKSISVPDEEVEFDLPDSTSMVISIQELYRMGKEMEMIGGKIKQEGFVAGQQVECDKEAVRLLLRPKMADWIMAHPGKAIPNKIRVDGWDVVSGEVGVTILDAKEIGVVRIPMEVFFECVTSKKVKVLEGEQVLAEGTGASTTLEPIRSLPPERPLSLEVKPNQVYSYQGKPSKHLYTGGNFRVISVDDETEVVRIVTAQEAVAAEREGRKPKIFEVRGRSEWERLPKTFVRGPKGEETGSSVEEKRVLKEIRVGQIYAYEGPQQPPLQPKDQLRIVAKDEGKKTVTFHILRQEEEARTAGKKPQPYTLPVSQWNVLRKQLVSSPSGPEAGRPASPPPGAAVPGAAESATSAPERPDTTVASMPKKLERIETPPGSFKELVELIRSKDLVNQIKAKFEPKLPKSAGPLDYITAGLSAARSVFEGDPFETLLGRIRTIAKESEAQLTLSKTFQERLKDGPFSPAVATMHNELGEAVNSYQGTADEVLSYITNQFNDLLEGNRVGTDLERIQKLETVQKAVKRMQMVNEKARKFLQPPSPPPAGLVPAAPPPSSLGTTKRTSK